MLTSHFSGSSRQHPRSSKSRRRIACRRERRPRGSNHYITGSRVRMTGDYRRRRGRVGVAEAGLGVKGWLVVGSGGVSCSLLCILDTPRHSRGKWSMAKSDATDSGVQCSYPRMVENQGTLCPLSYNNPDRPAPSDPSQSCTAFQTLNLIICPIHYPTDMAYYQCLNIIQHPRFWGKKKVIFNSHPSQLSHIHYIRVLIHPETFPHKRGAGGGGGGGGV